jgi:predicted nucleic acid-binding protein
MAFLLDTMILPEGRKPRREPKVMSFYRMRPLDQLCISVVSFAEIRFGIELESRFCAARGIEGLAHTHFASDISGPGFAHH